jgi:hypothetical protein
MVGSSHPRTPPASRRAALDGAVPLVELELVMRCFACDAAVDVPPGDRVGFRATCADCDADLHCCRNCLRHDPGAQNQCREPSAEWVSDRERANHCEYFAPSDRGGGEAATAASAAKTALEGLFKK